jgi:hypothetical protein
MGRPEVPWSGVSGPAATAHGMTDTRVCRRVGRFLTCLSRVISKFRTVSVQAVRPDIACHILCAARALAGGEATNCHALMQNKTG